jgi:hypothetical protein
MLRIDPRYIGTEEARRREALAREIAEGWRDWEEYGRCLSGIPISLWGATGFM